MEPTADKRARMAHWCALANLVAWLGCIGFGEVHKPWVRSLGARSRFFRSDGTPSPADLPEPDFHWLSQVAAVLLAVQIVTFVPAVVLAGQKWWFHAFVLGCLLFVTAITY